MLDDVIWQTRQQRQQTTEVSITQITSRMRYQLMHNLQARYAKWTLHLRFDPNHNHTHPNFT